MADAEVDFLIQAAASAIERGEPVPAHFLIPLERRRWRVLARDLVAVGENDLGIPPRAFAYGAVGMLLGSVGATRVYAMEAPGELAPPELVLAQPSDQAASRQAVVVTVFAKGLLEVHVQPFGRDGAGTIVWGERTVRTSEEPRARGAAGPLWRAVTREPGHLPPPAGLVEDRIDSGFSVFLEE
ncbi:MAG: hypothetical protein NVSMB32_01130 [Actinomycetota bacterium]